MADQLAPLRCRSTATRTCERPRCRGSPTRAWCSTTRTATSRVRAGALLAALRPFRMRIGAFDNACEFQAATPTLPYYLAQRATRRSSAARCTSSGPTRCTASRSGSRPTSIPPTSAGWPTGPKAPSYRPPATAWATCVDGGPCFRSLQLDYDEEVEARRSSASTTWRARTSSLSSCPCRSRTRTRRSSRPGALGRATRDEDINLPSSATCRWRARQAQPVGAVSHGLDRQTVTDEQVRARATPTTRWSATSTTRSAACSRRSSAPASTTTPCRVHLGPRRHAGRARHVVQAGVLRLVGARAARRCARRAAAGRGADVLARRPAADLPRLRPPSSARAWTVDALAGQEPLRRSLEGEASDCAGEAVSEYSSEGVVCPLAHGASRAVTSTSSRAASRRCCSTCKPIRTSSRSRRTARLSPTRAPPSRALARRLGPRGRPMRAFARASGRRCSCARSALKTGAFPDWNVRGAARAMPIASCARRRRPAPSAQTRACAFRI